MQMLIQNAKLRDREELVNILIDGGKIVEIGAGLTAEAETVIDAEGNLTTASYIERAGRAAQKPERYPQGSHRDAVG